MFSSALQRAGGTGHNEGCLLEFPRVDKTRPIAKEEKPSTKKESEARKPEYKTPYNVSQALALLKLPEDSHASVIRKIKLNFLIERRVTQTTNAEADDWYVFPMPAVLLPHPRDTHPFLLQLQCT